MCALLSALPLSAVADPKGEALQVLEKFKAAFDASDVQGVVKLFAPDAIFLGTSSPRSSRQLRTWMLIFRD
jgi:ketosteroid isomerase-like protein